MLAKNAMLLNINPHFYALCLVVSECCCFLLQSDLQLIGQGCKVLNEKI